MCVDKSKNVSNCIKNKKFNSLHSLNKTENGFLLTSSGLDLILEINDSGNSIFEWWAIEHGFNKIPSGNERAIDKNKDHSIEIYPTLSQTTHINSAINYEHNSILATLFHQGILIKINKNDGSYVNLLDGLSKPHAIYNTQDGFLLSDTYNNRSLILNREFKVVNEINEKFKWVQDTILGSNGNFIIADADNNRMVEVSVQDKINSLISTYNFNKGWRIFQIKEISHDQFNEFFR